MRIRLSQIDVEKIIAANIIGANEGTKFRWIEEYADGSGTNDHVQFDWLEFEAAVEDVA